MGLYQHHDAVAGTAKQYVADDYIFQLYKAMEINKKLYSSVITDYVTENF